MARLDDQLNSTSLPIMSWLKPDGILSAQSSGGQGLSSGVAVALGDA